MYALRTAVDTCGLCLPNPEYLYIRLIALLQIGHLRFAGIHVRSKSFDKLGHAPSMSGGQGHADPSVCLANRGQLFISPRRLHVPAAPRRSARLSIDVEKSFPTMRIQNKTPESGAKVVALSNPQ